LTGLRARLHALVRELLRGHRSPVRVAAAVFVGIVIGCTPFFGLHIVLCVVLAYLLRLNQVVVYAAGNISIPPMIPVLGLASVELGERLRNGRFLGLDLELFRSQPVRTLLHRFFFSWMLGGLVVGVALGLLAALVTWLALRRRRYVPDPVSEALEAARGCYERVHPKYKWYALGKYLLDPCYRAIAPKVPAGTTSVDLGTGLGMLPVVVALLGEERRVVGIEWDEDKASAARQAAAGLPGVEITSGDARSIPLPACDVITIVDMLHYYDADSQREILSRCRAALRPGGRLLIREGDGARRGRSALTRGLEQLVTRLGWNRGPHVWFRPIAELEDDLRGLGFTVARDEVAGRLHPGNVLLDARLSPMDTRP
jgi:uncharacterized protein (DUF2062 family)/SAM-dependent methyltransferase